MRSSYPSCPSRNMLQNTVNLEVVGDTCFAASGDAIPEIAVIVPVYNGRPMLEELCRRLVGAVETITNNFVIVLVDDVAPDDPWPIICNIGRREPRIKGVRLSR